MTLMKHIVITVPLAVSFYLITRATIGAIGVFISGILTDMDRLIEFWHDRGFSFNLMEFFEYLKSDSQSRYFIFSHSYEACIFFYILCRLHFFPYFFEGMAVGVILHLFLDYIAMQYKGCGKWNSFILFSFIFRLFLGFKRVEIDRLCKNACKCGSK